MSERELIAKLRQLFPRAGDDAAVIGSQVITSDMLVEDVDFVRQTPIALIARKSLSVNLSDLAAMGAVPSHAVVAVGLPAWVDVDEFFGALASYAQEQRIEIVGGDLSRSDRLVISIAAVGTTDRPLLRSGARPGDRIYVSRPIGASAAGLQLLLANEWRTEPPASYSYAQREFAAAVIRRHLDPEPEVALGIALGEITEITSCIDISDGLSTDLHNLCEASGCGAAIERQRLPLFPDLMTIGGPLGIRPQDAVLHGGEEYALLFTSSLPESQLSARLRRPVYAIGRMSQERVVSIDGEPLAPGGFDHFS